MGIRIYLTGRVGVAIGGELVVSERQFRDRQGRRAFAYLVNCHSRPVPRAELTELVWAGDPPRAWDSALNALVSRIRALLSCNGLRSLGVSFTSGFGQYQLSLPADTWVDLEAASSAIDEAEGALKAGDLERAFGEACVAQAIASRPFLSGDDGDWVEAQRRVLNRQFLRAIDCLSHVWLLTGQPILAVETASQAVLADPFRESSFLHLMKAHAACGNRPEAIRTYHRLKQFLVDELGTDPSPETEALYLELLR